MDDVKRTFHLPANVNTELQVLARERGVSEDTIVALALERHLGMVHNGSSESDPEEVEETLG